jgi:hypothetical protein
MEEGCRAYIHRFSPLRGPYSSSVVTALAALPILKPSK